jgi:hypothetical protein
MNMAYLSSFTDCLCNNNKKTLWPESASELYRQSDRRLSAKLLPTVVDRGCHVISVTDLYGLILGFLDRTVYAILVQFQTLISLNPNNDRSKICAFCCCCCCCCCNVGCWREKTTIKQTTATNFSTFNFLSFHDLKFFFYKFHNIYG